MKTVRWFAILCALVLYALCAAPTAAFAQKKGNPAAPPNLSGLYRAFAFVPQFGAAVGEAYVFSPGGNVYKGWPGTESPDTFDFVRAQSKEPGNTGKYVISGDKITFHWSNKQSETANFSFRRDPQTGKTDMTIGTYHAWKVIAWNQMLDGTFEPSTYQGGFSELNKQSPPLLDCITFSPNGQFTITSDDSAAAQPPLKGRYKISGATLTLHLPSGDERIYSLHVFEDHKQPPTGILINGRPFLAKTK